MVCTIWLQLSWVCLENPCVVQFLVFKFHYVKILAALYRGFLGCVLPCEFSVSPYCMRQSALPTASTYWFGLFLLTMFSSVEERQARRWVFSACITEELIGLLRFLKGLYHLLVLADIIRRAFYWFVVDKIQLPAPFLAAQVAKPGGRLLSN